MKITEEDYYIHAEEWGNGYALLIEDGEGSIQKMEDLKLQIISNQKKADKYDDYHKDNWIAIPRTDFDVMRKELKEEEQENKRLKEAVNKLKEKTNRWLDIDFDNKKLTELKWNDDKTVGYKVAVHDFYLELDRVFATKEGKS